MISDDRIPQYPSAHLRVLGICWVIYGVIRLFAAVWLVSFSNTATLMFGALLGRVPDPFTMIAFFHFLYTVVVALSVVCGALGILAGWAVLAGQRSGRTLTLIAGFLSLSEIPLGITLGTYSLIVLLPMTARYYSAAVLDDRTADFKGHPSAT
jgi:hypothetical protein